MQVRFFSSLFDSKLGTAWQRNIGGLEERLLKDFPRKRVKHTSLEKQSLGLFAQPRSFRLDVLFDMSRRVLSVLAHGLNSK